MLGFDPRSGRIVELFFTSRGKIGQEIDEILMDLGIEISRALQRPGPTGTGRQDLLTVDLGGRIDIEARIRYDASGALSGLDLWSPGDGLCALIGPLGGQITEAVRAMRS